MDGNTKGVLRLAKIKAMDANAYAIFAAGNHDSAFVAVGGRDRGGHRGQIERPNVRFRVFDELDTHMRITTRRCLCSTSYFRFSVFF
jgi:hypothetical protein